MLPNEEIYEFLDYLTNIRKYSKATVDTYEKALLEAAPLVEISEEDAKKIYDIRGYRLKISKLAKKTIAKKVSALRSFFEYKKMMGVKIKALGDEQIKTPKSLPKPIHKEIIQKALDACITEDEKLLVLMLYSLGLRISELEHLQLENIVSGWIKVVDGKGGKDRMIPLIPSVEELLRKHLALNKNRAFVFEENAKPLSQNCLRYKLTKIFERVGVKATPHQLRHSFASDLINKGARIVDVSELLGHKELSTTQIYTKLSMNKKLFSYLDAHPMCKE
jgi:integrase/recombinase XerC